ncbi:hypothetical protein ZIOFF_012288 [Zingiber officinale]|uniref:Uncharacterized protein n=1 Tax=Zingiber officinale TaxID=94328 RepID=A0A8J5HZS7_ZINOF|nr:hypothetical protein ZIOFF_012288 [Zingiber officinale]
MTLHPPRRLTLRLLFAASYSPPRLSAIFSVSSSSPRISVIFAASSSTPPRLSVIFAASSSPTSPLSASHQRLYYETVGAVQAAWTRKSKSEAAKRRNRKSWKQRTDM